MQKFQLLRRSKLEMHISILKALTHHGPLRLTHIMHKANVNSLKVKECLGFLEKNGLVKKALLDKDTTVFSITKKGVSALTYFKEIEDTLLAEENAFKHLDI